MQISIWPRFRAGILLICLAATCGIAHADGDPRLVVVIAVDQLRNDRLTAELPGGLGRLLRGGRRFVDSSVDHGLTTTCPGHAVLTTGVHPGRAGIPGNRYVDRADWRNRYCVDDDDDAYRVIGGSANRSPGLLRASDLGDWLRAAHPEAKVFSVGGKDRSAIMMGGRKPDGVFWFEPDLLAFTSSGYYAEALPGYVAAFNAGLKERLPLQWHHGPGSVRPDDFPGESTTNRRTSGHPVAAGKHPGRQIQQSPFVDDATFDLAQQLITGERLGNGAGPDLLTIALAALDTVGHLYGPLSAEAEDTLQRLDARLAVFLDELDTRFGADNYLVALSADHGVTDLPEWSLHQGTNRCPVAGSRLSYASLVTRVYGRIYWRHTFPFDAPTSLMRIADSQVYVNANYLRDRDMNPTEVLASLKQIFESTPGVKAAWTLDEVATGTDEAARLLRNSVVPGRSGDLFIQLHPDCMIGSTGTTHGSLYPPDRSVPLLFYGSGVVPGADATPARSVDLAPTVAHHIGIAAPRDLDGAALPLTAR
ncbi:MAG: alkaline phosphatase family protein [Pseudomonadales bacterium]